MFYTLFVPFMDLNFFNGDTSVETNAENALLTGITSLSLFSSSLLILAVVPSLIVLLNTPSLFLLESIDFCSCQNNNSFKLIT